MISNTWPSSVELRALFYCGIWLVFQFDIICFLLASLILFLIYRIHIEVAVPRVYKISRSIGTLNINAMVFFYYYFVGIEGVNSLLPSTVDVVVRGISLLNFFVCAFIHSQYIMKRTRGIIIFAANIPYSLFEHFSRSWLSVSFRVHLYFICRFAN